MTEHEAANWNSKYDKFYLSRYRAGRYRRVGKPKATIQEALAAAKAADERDGYWMTFIDVDV